MNIQYTRLTEGREPDLFINDMEYVKSPDKELQKLRYEFNQAHIDLCLYIETQYKEGEEVSLNLSECEAGVSE